MTLITKIWFIVVLIIQIVNGEYLPFEGSCPDPTSPENLDLDLNAKYYVIGETVNGTIRTNLADIFQSTNPDSFIAFEVFRFINDVDNCEQIELNLRQLEKGKYALVQQSDDDPAVENYTGDIITFLSENVVFFCRTVQDESKYYAEVGVINQEPIEFDADIRKNVEDLLQTYQLAFMYEYLNEVMHDNPCEFQNEK